MRGSASRVFFGPVFQLDREQMKERMLTRTVTYPDNFNEHSKSLCDALLAKEVDQRLGFRNGCCDELRAHAFFSDINWRKLNAGTMYFLYVCVFFRVVDNLN